MIAAIVQAIQTDATLIQVMRLVVTQNINNVSDQQLAALTAALGLGA